MENQEINKRTKGPKFTEQEDMVIKLAIERTEGNMDVRCKVAAKALNRPIESIKGRYYTLLYLGKIERVMFPRSPKYIYEIETKPVEAREPEPEPQKPVRVYKPRKKKAEEEIQKVETPSKWRRILNILFNK